MPKNDLQPDVDDEKIVDFAYGVMEKRLVYLKETFHAWMTKIGFLMAFVGVVTFYYLGHFLSDQFLENLNPWIIFIKVGTLVSLSLSMLSLMIAAKNRQFFDAPQPRILYSKEKLNLGSVKLKNKMVADMVKCHSRNIIPLEQIACWVNIAWHLLVIGIVGILISVLV